MERVKDIPGEYRKQGEGRKSMKIALPGGQQSRPLGLGKWRGSQSLYSKIMEDSIYLTYHSCLMSLQGN